MVCLLGDGRGDIFEVDMICLVTCFLHSVQVLCCQSQEFEESSENECLLTESKGSGMGMFKMCQVCLYISNELLGKKKNFHGHQAVHLNEGICLSQKSYRQERNFHTLRLKKTPTPGAHY